MDASHYTLISTGEKTLQAFCDTVSKDVMYQSSGVLLLFSEDICNQGFNITMCPLCDKKCGYWNLHDVCFYARLTHLFDNDATVLFAVIMSFWSKNYPNLLHVFTFLERILKKCFEQVLYFWSVGKDMQLKSHIGGI